ncbi:hypothetical protein P7K49_010062 [Saguinus oedipus]|uniref:Uncharacterized protein n=1 Tax=Saguinus oedipus TaxID=9490 RepID=A0ABQ9VME4_SAGOE|nr:hypothetical protein P7K49_010062 [Saguinus oedipus]
MRAGPGPFPPPAPPPALPPLSVSLPPPARAPPPPSMDDPDCDSTWEEDEEDEDGEADDEAAGAGDADAGNDDEDAEEPRAARPSALQVRPRGAEETWGPQLPPPGCAEGTPSRRPRSPHPRPGTGPGRLSRCTCRSAGRPGLRWLLLLPPVIAAGNRALSQSGGPRVAELSCPGCGRLGSVCSSGSACDTPEHPAPFAFAPEHVREPCPESSGEAGWAGGQPGSVSQDVVTPSGL